MQWKSCFLQSSISFSFDFLISSHVDNVHVVFIRRASNWHILLITDRLAATNRTDQNWLNSFVSFSFHAQKNISASNCAQEFSLTNCRFMKIRRKSQTSYSLSFSSSAVWGRAWCPSISSTLVIWRAFVIASYIKHLLHLLSAFLSLSSGCLPFSPSSSPIPSLVARRFFGFFHPSSFLLSVCLSVWCRRHFFFLLLTDEGGIL